MKSRYDELVDLHVAVVPQKHWNQQLNHANHKVLATKISAGFIRVSRESALHSLRNEISKQIGLDKQYPDYLFLRNVAECLVLVHRKQEDILKSADFAPPSIEYPELLVLPVTAAKRLLSSHGYSNRSSVQRSESSCTASVNGSTANQSTASSVAKNEGNVHHSESGNNSLISEPPAPVLQLTTLHRPAHNVTSHIEGKLNNGVLEKLDPDGQSSARTIVRSGSSHILHNRAGRDSAQSSFYRRWPDHELPVSANSKSMQSHSKRSSIANPSVPKYGGPIVTDAYLSDLRDRQGSGSSSTQDDFTRKWGDSHASPSQAQQHDASKHESPHSSTMAYFIKSTVNERNTADSPAQASPSTNSSRARHPVHSRERHKRYEDDYQSEGSKHTIFSESQDFRQNGRRTSATPNHGNDRIRSDTTYDERFPSELSKQGSTTNSNLRRQSAADKNEPAIIMANSPNPASYVRNINIIPTPIVIRKSEQVNAVSYQNRDHMSDKSDGDASTIRDTSSPSEKSLRNARSRYSESKSSDPIKTTVIALQKHPVDLTKQHQEKDSQKPPSSHSESIRSNLHPGPSDDSQWHTEATQDHLKSPSPDDRSQPILDDHQSYSSVDQQKRSWQITSHSPSQYGDTGSARGYEEHIRYSATRVSPPSDRPINTATHSIRHNNEQKNIHETHPYPKTPWPYSGPRSVPGPIQSPSVKSIEVTESPLNPPHEIITNIVAKENISTPISEIGLQPISRGTPDGTYVSKRPEVTETTCPEEIPSRSSFLSDDEEPSDIVPNLVVEPRGGYADSPARPDLVPPFQNRKNTINQQSNDQSETATLPSQGHESAFSDYQEPQHAKTKTRHESHARDLDEDSHLRSTLWQDLRKIRERRERLEEIRQVTIKEARFKAAMISRKRDGSQDVWKKRYHEEKKMTDSLTKFYQALESQCNNLNQNSNTTDNVASVNRKRNTKRTTYTDQRPSFKKNSELQAKRIITQINDMKSRLAEVKAKLAAEIKVRHDIEQELKAMRKGLLSKKIQSNLAFRRINHYEELVRAPKGIPRRRYRKY